MAESNVGTTTCIRLIMFRKKLRTTKHNFKTNRSVVVSFRFHNKSINSNR